ncbi:EthD family reductase [Pseudomonas sp.]|uniref:EthD family reductase n=1 Tax=Pseudomonas sp. TaxID=306 RepID=UPI0028A78BED|nr:EthD family reductase [Pseudomonas sp.]
MIKVSVLYPNRPGVTFDMDYYCATHMPLVRECLGDACKGIGAELGLAGGAPGSPAPYVAAGHLLFDSVEAFQSAFAPHTERILGDLANFTDVEPLMQIAEVRLAP